MSNEYLVAIPLEWCRARYPLVEVNDDDFRKSNDDDFRKDYDDDSRGNFYLSCFSWYSDLKNLKKV